MYEYYTHTFGACIQGRTVKKIMVFFKRNLITSHKHVLYYDVESVKFKLDKRTSASGCACMKHNLVKLNIFLKN